ncbi:purine nucleoside phosphorylase LACC1-like [Clupea harengus]|uniref:Purine nucleoside phosphorylase LACC1 n=1 Tax=Clupea harengus TaxID=7950 RepID=A0A8M1KK83_CLUHA|nr:purine nucleoside phosphorylase LACC1-like [Clupea harengus]
MAKVVVLDLDSVPRSEDSRPNCYEAFTGKISMILSQAGEVHEPVYLICVQCQGSSATPPERFVSLRKQVRVLQDNSVSASMYTIKQELDNLDLSNVVILTSSHRRAVLQKYQESLFTALYNFEYITVFDDQRAFSDSPTSLTSGEITEVTDEVSTFLRQLPAVGEMTVLKSSLVPDSFSHGFSTRTGGISYISTLSSLNLFSSSSRRDPKAVVLENIRRLGLQVGFQPHQFHLVKTDHASDVWVVGEEGPERYDGIVTNQVNVVIAAPGADCMPLLFTDPVSKVIGVAHAGWKGTLMGIAMATVNAMVTRFDSKTENILAVIGPSVGSCCFKLEQESAKEFHAIHPDCVRDDGTSKPYVNIRLATRILLEQGGLLSKHIHDDTVTDTPSVTLCTSCRSDMFFSHVRDGTNFGTQIGFLWIKE